MDDFEVAVRDYMQRCLRANESLVTLERATLLPGTLLPPIPGSSPYAWVGFTRARLITHHEGGRVVGSYRLPELARLEVNRHRGRWWLVWQSQHQLEPSIANVSRGFAKSMARIIDERALWEPVVEESTMVTVQYSETSGVPAIDAIMTQAGLSTETASAWCRTCGGWCGGLTEEGSLETDECGSCLRHITGIEPPA